MSYYHSEDYFVYTPKLSQEELDLREKLKERFLKSDIKIPCGCETTMRDIVDFTGYIVAFVSKRTDHDKRTEITSPRIRAQVTPTMRMYKCKKCDKVYALHLVGKLYSAVEISVDITHLYQKNLLVNKLAVAIATLDRDKVNDVLVLRKILKEIIRVYVDEFYVELLYQIYFNCHNDRSDCAIIGSNSNCHVIYNYLKEILDEHEPVFIKLIERINKFSNEIGGLQENEHTRIQPIMAQL